MSQSTLGGKTFYSNNEEFLQGVDAGASYINCGHYKIGNIVKSDNPDYAFMLVIKDSDEDEMQYEHC